MRPIILAVFLSVVVIAGVTGNAAAPTPILDDDRYLLSGPGPLAYTCDAPPGKFNQVHAVAAGDHVVVTGNIHIVTMHPTPVYTGVTFVGFYNKKSKRTVALQLLATISVPGKISFSILNGDLPSNASVFAEQPNKVSDFPFTIRLDQGKVSISVAGVAIRSRARPSELNGLTLGCGGAHVEYTNVVIAVPQQVNE
ncbi:MAG: hypothetical protein WA825_14290 [Steroidobacteraceae bacterium]